MLKPKKRPINLKVGAGKDPFVHEVAAMENQANLIHNLCCDEWEKWLPKEAEIRTMVERYQWITDYTLDDLIKALAQRLGVK